MARAATIGERQRQRGETVSDMRTALLDKHDGVNR